MFIFNDSAFWFSHKDDSMIDEFVDLLKKEKATDKLHDLSEMYTFYREETFAEIKGGGFM